jgi:signal peptidase I
MATAFSDTTTGKVFNFVIGREKKKHSHGDPAREVFETVVFVVVLVLLLKLFVAEAFVIPTGSMASTLWGDQVKVTCPDCGHAFAVSAAASHGVRTDPSWTDCQNCGLSFQPVNSRDWNSGDRVLVGKYEYHIRTPKRFEVPVFKFPAEPYSRSDKSAMNYIKRLVGLPGETICIYKGDLYRTTSLTYPGRPRPERPEDLWERDRSKRVDYTYAGDEEAVALFLRGGFEPIRKTPDEILTVRRLVFNLDQPPKSLSGVAKTRWHPSPDDGTGWTMDENGFTHEGGTQGWMRYHHIAAGSWQIDKGTSQPSIPKQPELILDHLSYNVAGRSNPASFWVPDLIVECTALFSATSDRLTLELTKAGDKFQAVFEGGSCKLYRVTPGAPDKPELLAEQPSKITWGKYSLRFANVDSRLTVWIDGKALDFGIAADYPPPNRQKFEQTSSDLHEPVRIGAVGIVVVSKVSLWRDVYYTPGTDLDQNPMPISTYYVQPGHYFCLGDNSASSADGRDWGLVPERLMLGRAVVVYWPASWQHVLYVVAVAGGFLIGMMFAWLVAKLLFMKETPIQLERAFLIVCGIIVAVLVAYLLVQYWTDTDPGRIGVIK